MFIFNEVRRITLEESKDKPKKKNEIFLSESDEESAKTVVTKIYEHKLENDFISLPYEKTNL